MEPHFSPTRNGKALENLFLEPVNENPGMRLSESMAEHFKGMIATGALKVGDKLPTEHQLCKYFSVSRSTLRESMQILRAHGYLDVSPGRGSFVKASRPLIPKETATLKISGLAENDYEDALRVIKGLVYTAYLPLKKSPRNLLNLIISHEIGLTDSPEKLVEKEHGWRVALAKESGNAVLVQVLEQLLSQTYGYCVKRMAVEEHRMQVLTKQQVVLSYLERGDMAAVERFFSL
jgi:GntR family transcriptional repressor for pyruvate dehydrogenase complex